MSPDPSPPDASIRSVASKKVSLSPWVNEQFPGWDQLLSAHDIARLTRRPRWALLGLMVLGRFPRKRVFHGRRIGWLRSDVLNWMTDESGCVTYRKSDSLGTPYLSGRQMCLPFSSSGACTLRRRKRPCSLRRIHGRR